MFDDWKDAWRAAVENFRRELAAEEDGAPGGDHVRAMRRELATVRGALHRLDTEIAKARDGAGSERESEQVCRRRQAMARDIGDAETEEVAREFAERHARRAEVLERKVAVLTEERELLATDLAAMEEAVGAAPGDTGTVEPGVRSAILDALEEDDDRRAREDRRFREMERERTAEERLEELKRKHR